MHQLNNFTDFLLIEKGNDGIIAVLVIKYERLVGLCWN